MVAVLLMTCKPLPTKISGYDAKDDSFKTKVVVRNRGDSNVVNINTYLIIRQDTIKIDTIR